MPPLAQRSDFQLVADELRDILRMEEGEAEKRGAHNYFYPAELIAAVNVFLEAPSRTAARHLQHAAPVLNPLFKACSPGGHLYEFKKMFAN